MEYNGIAKVFTIRLYAGTLYLVSFQPRDIPDSKIVVGARDL